MNSKPGNGVLVLNGSDPLLEFFKNFGDLISQEIPIPFVGPILGFLFNTFFGGFSSEKLAIDIWKLVKDQVKLLIDKSLIVLEKHTAKTGVCIPYLRYAPCNSEV